MQHLQRRKSPNKFLVLDVNLTIRQAREIIARGAMDAFLFHPHLELRTEQMGMSYQQFK